MLESYLRPVDNFTLPPFLGYRSPSYNNFFEKKICEIWSPDNTESVVAECLAWADTLWNEEKKPQKGFLLFTQAIASKIVSNQERRTSAFNVIFELRELFESHGLKP